MFGLVGWSVAVPIVAGVALGVWIDRNWPGDVSWTLTLLLAGAVLGAFNAWYWVQREGRGDLYAVCTIAGVRVVTMSIGALAARRADGRCPWRDLPLAALGAPCRALPGDGSGVLIFLGLGLARVVLLLGALTAAVGVRPASPRYRCGGGRVHRRALGRDGWLGHGTPRETTWK